MKSTAPPQTSSTKGGGREGGKLGLGIHDKGKEDHLHHHQQQHSYLGHQHHAHDNASTERTTSSSNRGISTTTSTTDNHHHYNNSHMHHATHVDDDDNDSVNQLDMTSLSISSNPNGTAGDANVAAAGVSDDMPPFQNNLMPNHHLKTPPPLRPRSSSDAVSSALDTDSHSKTYMGTVKFFNSQKGYGFIIPDDMSNLEVFVHHSAITKPKSGFRSLAEGEIVEFEMVQGDKGFQAANVTGPNGVDVQGDPHAYLYMMSNMLPPQNHHSPSFHPIHNYPLPTSPRDGPMRPPSVSQWSTTSSNDDQGSQYGGSNTGREPQRMPSRQRHHHQPAMHSPMHTAPPPQQRHSRVMVHTNNGPPPLPSTPGGMVGAYYPQPHPSSNTHLHRSASSSSSYASSVTAPSPSPSLSSPPTIHSMSGVPSSGSASVGSSAAGEQPQRHSKHRGHRQHQSGASLSHPPTQEMVYPGAVQGPQYYYPDQYGAPTMYAVPGYGGSYWYVPPTAVYHPYVPVPAPYPVKPIDYDPAHPPDGTTDTTEYAPVPYMYDPATGAPVQYYAAPYPFYGTPQMPPPPPMPMSQQQQQSYVGPSPRRQSRQQRGVQQQGGQMGGQ